MALGLQRDIHCAIIGDDVILLDTNDSRYRAVPRQMSPAFQRMLRGLSLSAAERDALSPLVGSAVIETPEADTRPRSFPPRPNFALQEDQRPASTMAIAKACTHRIVALTQVKARPFRELLEGIQRDKGQINPANVHTRTEAIAKAFTSSCTWLARSDQCLPMSIALTRALLRENIPATMVIGVATGPFSAHCWVQVGDLVICDQVDSVNRYTPILAI